MASDWLVLIHVLYNPGQRPAPEEALDWIFDRGAHTEKGGNDSTCYYYAEGMDLPKSDMPTEQALSELYHKEGFIELWIDDLNLYFQNWDDYPGVPDLPYYTFKFPIAQLTPVETGEDEIGKANEVINLIADFADETSALYGFGGQETGERESDRQSLVDLRSGNLHRVFWFNYISEPIVSEIGRDSLLTAPAERVEERSDGAVLLLPYLNPRHREGGGDPRNIEEHLGI
jgi:hypothetical protein